MADRWFSPSTPIFSTNKTDHHDITKILMKVVLNTITTQNPLINSAGQKSKCNKNLNNKKSECRVPKILKNVTTGSLFGLFVHLVTSHWVVYSHCIDIWNNQGRIQDLWLGGAWVGEGSEDSIWFPAGPGQSPGGQTHRKLWGFEELQTFIWTTILNQSHHFYQTKKTWLWV